MRFQLHRIGQAQFQSHDEDKEDAFIFLHSNGLWRLSNKTCLMPDIKHAKEFANISFPTALNQLILQEATTKNKKKEKNS